MSKLKILEIVLADGFFMLQTWFFIRFPLIVHYPLSSGSIDRNSGGCTSADKEEHHRMWEGGCCSIVGLLANGQRIRYFYFFRAFTDFADTGGVIVPVSPVNHSFCAE
jgi:hypothetical protein